MGEVKLHGAWFSLFGYRVIWALKLKGIPFEYIEEDLFNKSTLLQQYNPVHKKVPVLVHGGKPICESMIIIEYINETWPQFPLLPSDPYERSLARFWVKFIDDKGHAIWKFFTTSTGEEHEKAKKETMEMLQTMEENGLIREEKKFFRGDQIGIVDIAFGTIAHWLGVIEDITGVKFIDAQKLPRLNAWIKNVHQLPIVKENLPDRNKMLVFYKQRREVLLGSALQSNS